MAETALTPKIINPAAATLTAIYSPPASKCSAPRGLYLHNRHATNDLLYRVAVSAAAAAVQNKDYLAYDVLLPAKGRAIISGIVLGATDEVRVQSDTVDLNAHLVGFERDVLAGVEDYRILGQAAPGAASITDLYRCASGSFAIFSGFWVCNRSATPAEYSIAIAPADAADDPDHYLATLVPISANDAERVRYSVGYTIDGTTVVRVYASTANLSFGLYGYGSVHTAAGGAAWTYYGPPLGLYFT